MSLAMLTEAEPFADEEQGHRFEFPDLATDHLESFHALVAIKPILESWHSHRHVYTLYYEDLLHRPLVRHADYWKAQRRAGSVLPSQTISTEQLPAWMSTQQLLDWVQLRAENAILQHENKQLRRQLNERTRPALEQDGRERTAPDPTAAFIVSGFSLPASLRALAATIEQSRPLLELEDDWDGAGTRGYAEQTWQRTVGSLVRYATALWEQRGIVTESVEILPGTDGALAIDWRTGNGELLITVPEDPTQEASYYADDGSGRRKSKGTLDTSAFERWLLCWLAG